MSLESESPGIWRVMLAASPLWLRGRPPRAAQPSGCLVLPSRLATTGARLVCLASCAHCHDARQILDALLFARRQGAALFDLASLQWTRPCPATARSRCGRQVLVG